MMDNLNHTQIRLYSSPAPSIQSVMCQTRSVLCRRFYDAPSLNLTLQDDDDEDDDEYDEESDDEDADDKRREHE